jgi:hypothetical protein
MGVLTRHLRQYREAMKKRERARRLTDAARLAVETLEWAAERALVNGGPGWEAETARCKAAQTALTVALQEFTP